MPHKSHSHHVGITSNNGMVSYVTVLMLSFMKISHFVQMLQAKYTFVHTNEVKEAQ